MMQKPHHKTKASMLRYEATISRYMVH